MNFGLVLPFGVEGRCLILFVNKFQVSTSIDQKFHHVILVARDSIVDWPLFLHISVVKVGSEVDQELCAVDVTFADRIINRRLSVLICPVEVFAT